MALIRKGGLIKYGNGYYTDKEGILAARVGEKVRIVEGWHPTEIIVSTPMRVPLCTADQVDPSSNISDSKFKIEAAYFERALHYLHKVKSGVLTVKEIETKLPDPDRYAILTLIETLEEIPEGIGKWVQTRDRVWWNHYRAGDHVRWLCIIRHKRKDKYTLIGYNYDKTVHRVCYGRFLSLSNAQRAAVSKIKREAYWIPQRNNKFNRT